jgi:iron complex transport system substrate-binding protein
MTGAENVDTPMPFGKKPSANGAFKFVVLLITAFAAIVFAIEWSRRVGTSEILPPVVDHQASQAFPRELRDATGETVVIPKPPQRIVSQTLGTDEILLAICASDRIAALSKLAEDDNFSNVVDHARQIGGRAIEGAEQILQIQADLIFVASYTRAENVNLLKASQAPVFRFANFNSIADIQANIRLVGYACGVDAKAESLIQEMNSSLATVRGRIPQDAPPTRVMAFGQGGYTAGANSTFNDLVKVVGALNVSAQNGIDGFAKLSVEKVIEWQPDFIVAGANQGENETVRNALLDDPVIATSRVGRADRIIVIDNRHLLAVSQYIVRGAEDLADGLYGKPR